jgi:hypothetical protein
MPESNEEHRVNIPNCIFCTFRNDDICLAYQQVLEDNSKKPDYCCYVGFIMAGGKDHVAAIHPSGEDQ